MIGFIGTSLQLQAIKTAHNPWLPKTRSVPYWTTSVFSSAVTDFVPIYESVTSSASAVRWLTLHSWTLNSLTNQSVPNDGSLANELCHNSGEPNISHPVLQFLCYSVFLCLTVAKQWIIPTFCHGNVC
jgi:hypothetical protein